MDDAMKRFASILSFAALLCLATPARAEGVLIVGAPSTESWLEDVRAKIAATGLISGPVDKFYAMEATPTAAQLAPYDAVLFFSDYPFADAAVFGNLLADYVDQGKGVVQMVFAHYSNVGLGIGGRFRSEAMDLWTPGSQNMEAGMMLGTVTGSHEIMQGVTTLRNGGGFYNTLGAIRPGAEQVATWSNGIPLLAVDSSTRPGRIVALNFYPPSSTVRDDFWDATSDGAILMANALNFAASAIRHRHTCIVKNERVSCWGANGKGQLGLGHTLAIGDDPSEIGTHLASVDLGDFPVEKVGTAGESTCALSHGRLKCFGRNDVGQLGLGDKEFRGDAANEMGDTLPTVNLGTGVLVKDFAMSGVHVCAVTTTDQLKCFGSNKNGQLGLGDAVARGDVDNMGDQLPFVNLGANEKVRQVAVGERHTCVLLQDNKLKCFGQGTGGRLGNGSPTSIGATAGQMGDALAPVLLGDGQITTLTAGRDFNCVQFAGGTVKCFGSNSFGQLGLGDNMPRGDAPSTMGGNLLPVDFGSNQIATSLSCGAGTCCVTLVQGTMKCWGVNFNGQLGIGDNVSRGARIQDMGDELPQVSLDRLSKIRSVSIKDDFLCAEDTHGMKCWGSNRDGSLGYGDALDRGNTPNTVPRLIPYLPL